MIEKEKFIKYQSRRIAVACKAKACEHWGQKGASFSDC